MPVKVKIICFAGLLFLTNAGISQERNASGHLSSSFPKTSSDTATINHLVQLADANIQSRPEQAFRYAQEARVLAEKWKYDKGLSAALAELGKVREIAYKDYNSAIVYYLQSSALEERQGTYDAIMTGYSCILNLYFYFANYPGAMKIAVRGLGLAESRHDPVLTAKFFNTIGYIYYQQRNTIDSKRNFLQYLQLSRALKDSAMIADAYCSLGDIGTAETQFGDALDYFSTSYFIYKRLNMPERTMYLSYKLSRLYKKMNRLPQAMAFARQTLRLNKTVSCNEYDRSSYCINAGDVYKAFHQYSPALKLAHAGLAIARHIHHQVNIAEGLSTLSGIYAMQHRYDSAFWYYTAYTALKDSISGERSRQEMADIHDRYMADKKDKEILILKQEQQLKEGQLSHQRLTRNGLAAALVFLVALLWLLYNRRRLARKAADEARTNHHKNEIFTTVIRTQEYERKRIAQHLHDTVGSLLSACRLNLEALPSPATGITGNGHLQYRKGLALLDEASSELRNISHNIMPASLSEMGLAAALKNLADCISPSSRMRIYVSTHGLDERLKEITEISIYSILLELVNNAVKYSGAGQLNIQLTRHPAYVNILVEDNGRGFDYPAVMREKKGMGLNNIASRVEYLKGRYYLETGEGMGTTVIIDIPLE